MEKQLFSASELEYVEDLLQQNLKSITDNEEYQKYDKIMQQVTEIIDDFPTQIKELFEKYDTSIVRIHSLETCLAYYIGIKRGLEIKEIKLK